MGLCHGTLRAVLTLALLLALPALADEEFPPASPEQVGLSAAALDELAGVVEAFVEEGRVMGAELLVVKDRRTVLRRAFGVKDHATGTPLEAGALYNIRSMTKPVVGTAAQVLADLGQLDLAAPVASILSEFDREGLREITLEQLLTHRAGFEWSACMEGASLRELARCAAKLGPTRFWPGTSFLYSNTGSNVLGAALAEVNGTSLEELVAAEVLHPLGLADTVSLGAATESQLARCVSAHAAGEDGSLQRVWSPADGPPIPFLQGAQGLASTTTDYARFLELWLDRGAAGERRLLTLAAVDRAQRPASLTELPTTFPGRRVYYGQHWKLWTPADSNRVEIFGHGGSDGTFAWAWPEHDLMVLYFTQTVLTSTGIELEDSIDRLLLGRGPAIPARLRPYLGRYWNEEKRMVRVVTARPDGELALDVVGTGAFDLRATDDPLRWEIPGRPGFDVLFERDEQGAIARLVPPPVTGETASTRLVPAPDLPTVEELMALRPDLAEHLGIFRMSGNFLEGDIRLVRDVLLSDGARRSREEVFRSQRGPLVTVCNGEVAESITPSGKRRRFSGGQRTEALLGRLAVLTGDWRETFDEVEVLARTEHEGRAVVVVQATPDEGWPVYYLVDVENGRALQRMRTLEIPLGSMAKISSFGDWREVEGVSVPFSWEGHFASKALGTWTLQYDEIETHLEVDEALFAIGER